MKIQLQLTVASSPFSYPLQFCCSLPACSFSNQNEDLLAATVQLFCCQIPVKHCHCTSHLDTEPNIHITCRGVPGQDGLNFFKVTDKVTVLVIYHLLGFATFRARLEIRHNIVIGLSSLVSDVEITAHKQ